jgi:hypothetical protein
MEMFLPADREINGSIATQAHAFFPLQAPGT